MVDDDDDFWSTEAGGSTSFKKFNCQFYSLASVDAAVYEKFSNFILASSVSQYVLLPATQSC